MSCAKASVQSIIHNNTSNALFFKAILRISELIFSTLKAGADCMTPGAAEPIPCIGYVPSLYREIAAPLFHDHESKRVRLQ